MRKTEFLILICGILALCTCQNKSPTVTPDNNIHPQVDIPWPSLADSPWPMFHHDPQSTGRSPYVGPRKGKIKWIFTPGGAIYNSIAIGPDSTIYFPTCYEIEGNKSALYALHPDGSLKWKIWLPIGSETQPMVIADGSILVSDGTSIYFIDPNNGGIIHQIDFSVRISSYLHIGIDGVLYFTAEQGHLYAVSQNGDLLWNIHTNEQFYCFNFPISPDGSTIYLFTKKDYQSVSYLYAIQTDNGQIKWKYPIKEKQNTLYSPLVDSDGNVYFGTFGVGDSTGFFSLSSQGNHNWYYPGVISNEPTIDYDGRIFLQTGNVNQLLNSLDYSGNIVWQQEIGSNKTTFICDREGAVYTFIRDEVKVSSYNSSGELLWQIDLEGISSRIAAPAIGYDGTLYFGTYQAPGKSKLYAIE